VDQKPACQSAMSAHVQSRRASCSTADTGVTSVPQEIVVEHKTASFSLLEPSNFKKCGQGYHCLWSLQVGRMSGLVLLRWTLMDGSSSPTASQDGVETRCRPPVLIRRGCGGLGLNFAESRGLENNKQ